MTKQERDFQKQQQTEKLSELEGFRFKVQENELIARYNKSEYDKMYYYLEAKRISAEFLASAGEDEKEREAMYSNAVSQIEEQVVAQNEQTGE